jgi:hypothetical protein
MMAFKAFGSGLLAATQPEDHSSTSFPTFGMGPSGGLWESPAQPQMLPPYGSSPSRPMTEDSLRCLAESIPAIRFRPNTIPWGVRH